MTDLMNLIDDVRAEGTGRSSFNWVVLLSAFKLEVRECKGREVGFVIRRTLIHGIDKPSDE